jgi:hypothetical protein
MKEVEFDNIWMVQKGLDLQLSGELVAILMANFGFGDDFEREDAASSSMPTLEEIYLTR